jgi:hypothetical protein
LYLIEEEARAVADDGKRKARHSAALLTAARSVECSFMKIAQHETFPLD